VAVGRSTINGLKAIKAPSTGKACPAISAGGDGGFDGGEDGRGGNCKVQNYLLGEIGPMLIRILVSPRSNNIHESLPLLGGD